MWCSAWILASLEGGWWCRDQKGESSVCLSFFLSFPLPISFFSLSTHLLYLYVSLFLLCFPCFFHFLMSLFSLYFSLYISLSISLPLPLFCVLSLSLSLSLPFPPFPLLYITNTSTSLSLSFIVLSLYLFLSFSHYLFPPFFLSFSFSSSL